MSYVYNKIYLFYKLEFTQNIAAIAAAIAAAAAVVVVAVAAAVKAAAATATVAFCKLWTGL